MSQRIISGLEQKLKKLTTKYPTDTNTWKSITCEPETKVAKVLVEEVVKYLGTDDALIHVKCPASQRHTTAAPWSCATSKAEFADSVFAM